MAKRKPPSQRAERKLDDLARAIASEQEEQKAKPPAERRPGENSSHVGRLVKSIAPRKETGPAPGPSTKRPKKV